MGERLAGLRANRGANRATRWGASRPVPARVGVLGCLAGVGYVCLFAAVDAFLEAHADTAVQMLVRLVLVSMALLAMAAFAVYLLQRAQVATEQVERWVQTVEEEARLQGALLTMREVAPWIANDAPNLASAARSTQIAGVSPSNGTLAVPSEVPLLTPREREVAILIAQGHTSREIAKALVITERTADTHADHIRAKLALRSRAEVAAWVLSRGLVSASKRPS